jgi:hypothetical protein
MYKSGNKNRGVQLSSGSFPNPLASSEEKATAGYGLAYAKAIYKQWGRFDEDSSLYRRRYKNFERNRDYANGTQDTVIYRQLLTSSDPNNGDGSMMNIDFTPVPILPKFVRIVVNKILSQAPYPNVEAIDPLSSSAKDKEKRKMEMLINSKQALSDIKQKTGMTIGVDPDELPDTLEEAEIFFGQNIKTTAEVAAQIATNLTLEWSDFNDNIFRRCVNDIATLGMAAVKRNNDPNYGIVTEYVDPSNFIHSYTEDPNLSDMTYAGHVKHMSIQELKRIAGDQLTEEEYEEIAKAAQKMYSLDVNGLTRRQYDSGTGSVRYGYDEYMIDVLDFEFLCNDVIYFEEKENRHGNVGFHYKGEAYKAPQNSVFERRPVKLDNMVVYGGCMVICCNKIFNYGKKTNIPKNMHDITRACLSYSAVAVNMRDMIPKSMVDSCIGFADQIQLSHLKLQQSIAKAKPDGIIIDIEGLENVQLGKGGDLQPLELHDIYEQTGVFYYRSKNPEGGFQNPPIREIGNTIRNINELIGIYNHYLRMIRDTTGINEAMDGSSPKGDQLVGVRQQAISAGNNAIYDITNSSLILYKKVCADVIKSIQIIPNDSVIFRVYENAIGAHNMKVISSFSDLYMFNFGITVVKDMEEIEKQYLENNIQISLSQKELDIEDAIAIRQLKDINQAEKLLILRRKKRMASQQQMAMQNSQMQAQMQQQSAAQSAEIRMQELQAQSQIKAQEMQLEAQLKVQVEQALHELRKEIEQIKAEAYAYSKDAENSFKKEVENMKEDRKDERVKKQAVEQSKLISQRDGKRGELEEIREQAAEAAQEISTGIISRILGR